MTVLRQPLLGDIEAGHNLQAAKDSKPKSVGTARDRLKTQHAIDTKSNPQAKLVAFDMHVTGSLLDGFMKKLVNKPSNRCVRRSRFSFAVFVHRQRSAVHRVWLLFEQLGDSLLANPKTSFELSDDLVFVSQNGL